MFHHRLDHELQKTVFVKWYLLSFLAGNVNAGGFLAAGRFTTHVTGFATLFGIDLVDGRIDQALGILFVPLFFLLGSMISAYLVDHRFHRGFRPHYDWVMLLVFLCLFAAAVGGYYDTFGVFGETIRLQQDFILLSLLCLASGLQNAAITTSSGSSVRTTHLTGLTTDLGIGIVRVWDLSPTGRAHHHEVRANWLRVGTILSYILGSVAGAFLFIRMQYLGFLLPAAIAFYALTQARREHKNLLREDIRLMPEARPKG